jgi:hypothetical protein
MAITTSGSISIKEAAGAANSIDTTVTSVSSGSLVTLSTNSINYTESTRGSSPRDTDASPYGMLEFSGYEHTSIDAWPTISLPSGNAGGAFPGAAGTEISSWGNEQYNSQSTAGDAWCDCQFFRDDANNRIKVLMKSGTSVALATEYWGYINYTGMSSPTFYVKHDYTGSVTNLGNNWSAYAYPDASPNITKNTYREMTTNLLYYQYFWVAKRDVFSNAVTARVNNTDVVFTVKIVSGGVDYIVSKDLSAFDVILTAKYGAEL